MKRLVQWISAMMLLLVISSVTLMAAEAAADVLITDSFESGNDSPDDWKQGAAVRGVKYVYDLNAGSDGKRSLSLQKSENRYFPIAEWSRLLKHTGDKPSLKVSAKVKAAKVAKAIIDVQFLDANDQPLKHEWIVYIGQKEQNDPLATHDWKTYAGTVEIPRGTAQIAIALQIYGPGKIWFDELEARYVDAATSTKGNAPGVGTSDQPAAPSVVRSPIEIPTPSGGVARYLLIPADVAATKPKSGYPVLLVLPGGDGSADFHPFIELVHQRALNGRLIVAQPLAPPQIVWPTRSSTARWHSTEESISAIVDDVAKRHAIDREQVYALAWSSSGPAIYETLLQERSPLAGAFIAMSVFKPDSLPPLSQAAGRRIYLLHSPEDQVCPYPMAKDARQRLAAAGAKVKLVDYAGGHGWHGPVFDNIQSGMKWLQERD